MDPPGSVPQTLPQASTTTTENPVVAIGRKVKSAFHAQQQPSVRILRGRQSSAAQETSEKRPILHESNPAGQHVDNHPGFGAKFRSLFGRDAGSTADGSREHEYDTDTVDLLDVVDPEVATLSTLTNVQNSLFVPSLGKFVNRRPTYRISDTTSESRIIDKVRASLKRIRGPTDEVEDDIETKIRRRRAPLSGTQGNTSSTSTSALSNAQYAILPDGESLPGWTNEEKDELDDAVRHMLHSRRAKFKRAMKGFSQYVRRPLGLFVTVYATLITLFGAAWVLFLIGWISLGSKQDYVVNVVDNVLVALFAIIGDGLAPFRAVDTYHMIYIAHYHRKTWKQREKLGLPELVDHNDLPDQRAEDVEPAKVDIESLIARRIPPRLARRIAPRIPKKLASRFLAHKGAKDPTHEYSVLTDEEQAKLEYHERKFSKSHTFYKPHETETHFAFPLKLLITVVVLLDCHSALQISLGACTWGINYHTRPFALTTVILCFSITCNIMAGVLISRGDKMTRKKDVIERMMRQELTSEAIEAMETRWLKEAEERGEVDKSVRKNLEEEKEREEKQEIKKEWKVVHTLPKKLLGKGEDHRQPSLPQQARGSQTNMASSSSEFVAEKDSTTKSKIKGALFPVPESSSQPSNVEPELPTRPKPAVRRGNEPPEETTRHKVMKMIRRADLDRT